MVYWPSQLCSFSPYISLGWALGHLSLSFLSLSWTPSKKGASYAHSLPSPQSVLYLDHRQKPLISNALIALITYHYRLIQLDPYVILSIHCLADYLRILSTCLQACCRTLCASRWLSAQAVFRLSKHDITHYTTTSLGTKKHFQSKHTAENTEETNIAGDQLMFGCWFTGLTPKDV